MVSAGGGSLGVDLPIFQSWSFQFCSHFADPRKLVFRQRFELASDSDIVFDLA
jgi:hypothetical protein